MSALKLSPLDPAIKPLTVSPETLLATLDSGLSDMEAICEELKCTPEDLAATLADPQTSRLVQIKTRLAAMQVHLMAIHYMPHAIGKLHNLVETSEKPEVVRRAATTLINMAGIPTNTASNPAPPPVAPPTDLEPEPEEIPDKDATLYALAKVIDLKRGQGLDINKIPDDLYPKFTQTLHDFFIAHRIPFYCEYIEDPYYYIDQKENENKDKIQDQTQTAQPIPTAPPS